MIVIPSKPGTSVIIEELCGDNLTCEYMLAEFETFAKEVF
jgi:hypothetical protein